jgi:hypothetical protein
MLAAGGILISLGYVFAFGFGLALALGSDYGSSPGLLGNHARGGTLLIPGIGPLVSGIANYKEAGWGLAWVLLDFPATVIGIGLVVQGTRTKELILRPLRPAAHAVTFRPYYHPDGGGMLAIGKF